MATAFNTQVGEGKYQLQFETDRKEHYLAMQEMARRCIDGKTMEWISVEERLPRCGERVLVTEGNGVFEAFLSISHNWSRFGIGWAEGVTHWMPLPPPPET